MAHHGIRAGDSGYNADMRNALKALGAILAVIALCAPLMFLPADDTWPGTPGYAAVTVTVPPTVVVATTIPGLETTTTTTEPPQTQPTAPTTTTSTTTTTGPTDITIAVAGGILVPPAILQTVHDVKNGSYDFGPVFAPVAEYLSKADYTVAALEPRLAGPAVGYASATASNAPRELAFALAKAGVDLVGTANPQALDLGWEGLTGTLDRLDAAGLAHVGTYRTAAERAKPFIADVHGVRVAFLDYTSALAQSLPADQKKDFAVNTVAFDTVRTDAATARTWGADAVVVMIDYGNGGQGGPDAKQTALADEILRDAGVDVVLGSDSAKILPIGHYFYIHSSRHKYVGYSLGGLLTVPEAQSEPNATVAPSGMVVYLHFQKIGLQTRATGVDYLPLYIQKATTAKSDPTTGGTTTTANSTSTTERAAGGKDAVTTFRILPVLLGLEPTSDVPLSAVDKQRMGQISEYFRGQLYRPDENIGPLAAGSLGQ
jgi:poly-gamma-glutamate capsule biosynthesis protein CapA/YwtB (metallophosphatase superfamily)